MSDTEAWLLAEKDRVTGNLSALRDAARALLDEADAYLDYHTGDLDLGEKADRVRQALADTEVADALDAARSGYEQLRNAGELLLDAVNCVLDNREDVEMEAAAERLRGVIDAIDPPEDDS